MRHVAFEDLGLLGALVSARGYDVRYHDAGVEPFDPETLVRPDLVIVLRDAGRNVLGAWLDSIVGAAA